VNFGDNQAVLLPIETKWANPPQSRRAPVSAEPRVVLQKTIMPIYEYSCAKCGKTIEVIQKMSDKPLKTHAGCGGKLTKLISAAGFQFKGTGWYVTDYAKKSQGESKDAAAATTGKDGGGEKSSSDKSAADKPAKPAPTTPPAPSGKTKKS
jgi:putative FmdB family regulatory protein